jgi:hypothetical protein
MFAKASCEQQFKRHQLSTKSVNLRTLRVHNVLWYRQTPVPKYWLTHVNQIVNYRKEGFIGGGAFWGGGKITYTFSANANVLSVSVLPETPPPRLTHPLPACW